MARTFTIDIVAPDRVILHDEATSLVAPGVLGSFGVLANHAPMLSELTTGELRYRRDSAEEIRLAVSGGFLQVFNNEVTVLADAAERAEEIDIDRARRARDEARSRLSHLDGFGAEREEAEAQLARAQTRLRVAAAS